MQLLRDYRHHYRGTWGRTAICRILVYLPAPDDGDRRPVVVCEELSENDGTSVTNMAEYLAAEIVARHFPALLDTGAEGGQPVRWLERYPPASGWAGEYDEVTVVPWRIRLVGSEGARRRALGAPGWRPLSCTEAAALADDLAPLAGR